MPVKQLSLKAHSTQMPVDGQTLGGQGWKGFAYLTGLGNWLCSKWLVLVFRMREKLNAVLVERSILFLKCKFSSRNILYFVVGEGFAAFILPMGGWSTTAVSLPKAFTTLQR